MRLAIADPPYLGVAAKFYGNDHPLAGDYDRPETHLALLEHLNTRYDGWALATHTPGLRLYLPHTGSDVRTAVWIKPSAGGSRPNVRVGYHHEYVLFKQPQARRSGRAHMLRRDVLVAGPSRRTGVIGAKPPQWTRWVCDLIGYKPGEDILDDLFPGSGLVQRELDQYRTGCEWCSEYLHQRRTDARFCSARCRVAAHRATNR